MAKASGTIQEPLTERDMAYARMLLAYSRLLDIERITLEQFQERWYGGEGGHD